MAIPVNNFPLLNFQQSNPFLSGVNAAQQIQANQYANQIQGATAQYAQQMAAQGLRQQILNNQVLNAKAQNAMPQQDAQTSIMQNTAKFAPLMSQSQLDTQAAQRGLMGAQSGYYGAQAQDIYQAQIPLQQAQAAMTRAQIPYVPAISMGKYYQGLGRVMQFSPSSMLMRYQDKPMLQSLVANNPKLAANLAGVNTAFLNGENPSLVAMGINIPGQGEIGSQLPPPQGQNIPTQNAPMSNGIPYAANATNTAPQTPINYPSTGMIPTPFGYVNPMDAANLQSQAQNAVLSKNYTPQQMQQITYENSAQNMLNQLLPDMQSISSFSGLPGMAFLKDQQLRASMNLPTSQDYQKYINFSRVQAPALVNEIRRGFGGQATDSEREIMDDLIDPVEWDKNPSLMLGQLQSLMYTLHANNQAIVQNKSQNLGQAINSKPLQVPQLNSQNNMVTVLAPNGQKVRIPSSNLSAALKRGARLA